jgi:hypothetical protein
MIKNDPGDAALAASITFCASSADSAATDIRVFCSSELRTNAASGGVKNFSAAKLARAVAMRAVVHKMKDERRMEFMVFIGGIDECLESDCNYL